MDPKAVIGRAIDWIRRHPEDVVQGLRNATDLKLTIPLDAFRFLAAEAKGARMPRKIDITAVPPGIRIGATLNAMKTDLRVDGTLVVDLVRIGRDELRVELRIRDLGLTVVGESDSPLSALIRSGALNLSQPGKLVAFLPKRPLYIVEASEDRIVLDLLRDPKLSARLRRVTSLVTPLVTVTSIESRGDALGVQLSCLPAGLARAVDSLREALSS